MKNKKLKELLNNYPDESDIYLLVDSIIANINCVSVDYCESDEYTIPDIKIEGNY